MTGISIEGIGKGKEVLEKKVEVGGLRHQEKLI
jgi:hypothetical protein